MRQDKYVTSFTKSAIFCFCCEMIAKFCRSIWCCWRWPSVSVFLRYSSTKVKVGLSLEFHEHSRSFKIIQVQLKLDELNVIFFVVVANSIKNMFCVFRLHNFTRFDKSYSYTPFPYMPNGEQIDKSPPLKRWLWIHIAFQNTYTENTQSPRVKNTWSLARFLGYLNNLLVDSLICYLKYKKKKFVEDMKCWLVDSKMSSI